MGTKRASARAPQTEWGSDAANGIVTTVRRDGDRATVVDVGDGVVRIRTLRLIRGGRWAAMRDTTVEHLCEVTPIDPDDAPAALAPLRLLRAA